MITDTGEMELSGANEMNVPVNCFLEPPDQNGGLWAWTATNFMPRKACCCDGYRLEADTKEEIVAAVNRYVVPLYETAVKNLKEKCNNYYWE